MIIKPTTPLNTSYLAYFPSTLDTQPTAVGHDSSPLAGLPFSGIGSHLLPDKFTLSSPLTRTQRSETWLTFWNNLQAVLKGGKFPVMFTTRGAQAAAKDTGLKYD
jgi:hypothetical protein